MTSRPMRSRPGRVAWMLFRNAFAADTAGSVFVFGTSVLLAVTPVVLAYGVQQVVAATLGQGSATIGVSALGAAFAAIVAGRLIEQGALTRLEERTDHRIENRLLGDLAGVPGIDLMEREDVQDALYLFLTRPRHLIGSISLLVGAVGMIIRVGSSVAYLAAADPWLGLVPFLVVVPAVGGLLVQREQTGMLLRITPQMRGARLLLQNAVDPQAAREIRIFGQQAQLRERQRRLLAEADRIQIRSRLWTLAITGSSWLVFVAGFAGVLAAAAAGHGGSFSLGVVVLLSVLAIQVFSQAEQTATLSVTLGQQAGYFEPVLWLRELAEQRHLEVQGRSAEAPTRLTGGIQLKGVGFRYLNAARDAVSGIDLDLPAGSTVAVVGHNGAGKSTLAKLLLGLYEPTSGSIVADGVDITAMRSGAWQGTATAAFQDYVRFEFTVQDSVGLGDLRNAGSAEHVDRALADVGAGRLLAFLPRGLATELGTSAGGTELSGGQWQQVAIARSAMRRAATVAVMDEPAASLDPERESELYRRLSDLRKAGSGAEGRISLLIAHRFATVRMADLIVVMDDGRVTAVGTHDELMDCSPWYRAVVEQQRMDYR